MSANTYSEYSRLALHKAITRRPSIQTQNTRLQTSKASDWMHNSKWKRHMTLVRKVYEALNPGSYSSPLL